MGIIQKRQLPRQLVQAWKTLETQTQPQTWNSLNLTTLTKWFDSSSFLKLRIIRQKMRLLYKEGSLLFTADLEFESCFNMYWLFRANLIPLIYSPRLCTGEISIKPSTFANSQWSTDTWKKEIVLPPTGFHWWAGKRKRTIETRRRKRLISAAVNTGKIFKNNNNKKCL